MVDVNSVYVQVQALSRKGQAGYHNGDDFNNHSRLVQNMLFDFYLARVGSDQGATDSLRPFVKESVIPIISGFVAIPADYRQRIRVKVGYVSGATTTYYTAPYLNLDEDQETSESYVRRPLASRRRFYHTLSADGIGILPSSFVGKVSLKYFRNPVDSVWAYTDNTTDIVEEYDDSTSVHFEWGAEDEGKLVDLFLYLKGIQVRHSELLEWVAMKNQFKQLP